MTAADQMIADHLRRRNKRTFLVANKVDSIDPDIARAEFSPLGLGDAVPIAAAHGRGINTLLELALGDAQAARAAWQQGLSCAQAKGDAQVVKELQVFLRRLDKQADGV